MCPCKGTLSFSPPPPSLSLSSPSPSPPLTSSPIDSFRPHPPSPPPTHHSLHPHPPLPYPQGVPLDGNGTSGSLKHPTQRSCVENRLFAKHLAAREATAALAKGSPREAGVQKCHRHVISHAMFGGRPCLALSTLRPCTMAPVMPIGKQKL
jgi:hypothetical protein